MKASEAMQILGLKLEEKYKDLGFKYKKSAKTFSKNSKSYTYMIAFFSFSGNTKNNIALDVCYIVNYYPYDPYDYKNLDEKPQPLYHSLWKQGIYLNVATEEKIEETFVIICEYMEKILIAKMNKLEEGE